MSRKSSDTDKKLIRAGRRFLMKDGFQDFNLRKIASVAKVNLGMFHYHFKTKDEFKRQVLQQIYEDFFVNLTVESSYGDTSIERLRSALIAFGKFSRDYRKFLIFLMRDLMNQEKVALKFVKNNFKRHASVISHLVSECQKEGLIVKAPLHQVISFIMSGIQIPNLIAGHIIQMKGIPKAMTHNLEKSIINDHAIVQRVEFALKGVSKR